MQTFNQIANKLKHIIGSDKDKAVAIALGIKPTTFASMKRLRKIPYAAILKYSRDNHISANTILLGEVLDIPAEEGKVLVRYFRSFEDYEKFIGLKQWGE